MAALTPDKIIAVIGAGTMGAGVAQVAAQAGHQVLLFDANAGAAQQGIDRTLAGIDKLVEKGKIAAAEREVLAQRLVAVEKLEDLAPAHLVIEAIVERLDIKQSVFKQLEDICAPDTLLATNTSSLSVTAIGAALKRPERLAGMHFFNPAPIMKLVEIISGLATTPEVLTTLVETAQAWGKQTVQAKSTPGFIVNRVARPFYAEGLRVLQEGGTDVVTIDAIMRESGNFRMGPFELMDLIGQDVNYAVTCSVHDAYYGDPRFMPSLIQKELVDAGFLGRKTGRGFYNYAKDATPPQPSHAPQCDRPESVTIIGTAPFAESIINQIKTAGMHLEIEKGDNEEDFIILAGEACLVLTDGRMATQVAVEDEISDLVLFDLALDYGTAKRIALAPADQTHPDALNDAIGFWQALGKQVSVIDDIPGMCVMRTVAMLANEGADAVNQGVCHAKDVDIAMQNGVNYPKGPLAWADSLGVARVLNVLDNLQTIYGEDRYRASPLLLRTALTGGTLV